MSVLNPASKLTVSDSTNLRHPLTRKPDSGKITGTLRATLRNREGAWL